MSPDDRTARPPDWALSYDVGRFRPFGYAADAVLLSFAPVPDPFVRLAVLLVRRDEPPFDGHLAFPGAFVDWEEDADALVAARRALEVEAGVHPPDYLETLDTYDASGRDPRQYAPDAAGRPGGARVVSKAHLALCAVDPDEASPRPGVERASVYRFLPWEDQRPAPEDGGGGDGGGGGGGEGGSEYGEGGGGLRARQVVVDRLLAAARGDDERAGRVRRAFGDDRTDAAGKWRVEWNEERAGERFRLLVEAGLVEEGARTTWGEIRPDADLLPADVGGVPLAFDHRLMLADALSRVRGKIKYLPSTLKALSGPEPTLVELHHAVEAVSGRPVDRGNFWRIFTRSRVGAFLEATDRTRDLRELHKRGPQPGVYRYREDADRLRLDPSIRYPWSGP